MPPNKKVVNYYPIKYNLLPGNFFTSLYGIYTTTVMVAVTVTHLWQNLGLWSDKPPQHELIAGYIINNYVIDNDIQRLYPV